MFSSISKAYKWLNIETYDLFKHLPPLNLKLTRERRLRDGVDKDCFAKKEFQN